VVAGHSPIVLGFALTLRSCFDVLCTPTSSTRGGARVEVGGLPAFAFAEVVLAIVLVVIAFGGGFRGSWRPFGFASADH
jgi:hypothetical protein